MQPTTHDFITFQPVIGYSRVITVQLDIEDVNALREEVQRSGKHVELGLKALLRALRLYSSLQQRAFVLACTKTMTIMLLMHALGIYAKT